MKYDTVTVRWADGEVEVGTPAVSNSRAGFIEDSSLTTEAQAVAYGTQWLATRTGTIDQVDATILPLTDGLRPWTGVSKGDAIRMPSRSGVAETGRLHGVGFAGLARNGVPRWTYTVGSAAQERAVIAGQQLTRLGQGSMRGSFGAATINPAPSYKDLDSGSLPKEQIPVADTDEFRLDEPYDRTKPVPFEDSKAIIRIECACESLVGSDDSDIEVWRVAFAADGSTISAAQIDGFTWPGDVYRYTHVTELQYVRAQGYQLRNAQAAGATLRLDEVSDGSIAAGAHRLITITAIASTAN